MKGFITLVLLWSAAFTLSLWMNVDSAPKPQSDNDRIVYEAAARLGLFMIVCGAIAMLITATFSSSQSGSPETPGKSPEATQSAPEPESSAP